ncbi:MAG: GNAT family N-acetyltransferase [Lewinellaceae bacterium]|nr:GNAT family N-acetyltransferase [Saprospiraceae bacterium]MCB9311986.1 GNAT family N-acetyltransferase [Lewinellaceae bacterium]
MSGDTAYTALCREIPDLPIFLEPWYLDALAPGWKVATVEKGGKTVAAWPYFPKRKGPVSFVTMPVLVRFMGPVFHPEFDHEKQWYKLIPELWVQIKGYLVFRQDAPYSLTNWLPLYWLGFFQYTRYSYTIDLRQGREAIWAHVAGDYRQQKIPKAREAVTVESSDDLEAFIQVHDQTFRHQSLPSPVSRDTISRLDAAAAARGQRRILLARDRQSGQVHAGLYLLINDHSVYMLMAGSDPALRTSGASILLTWEAIEWALTLPGVRTFDFLGSMIEPIERVRRQFGARQVPFFRISYLRWKWLALLFRGKI